MREFLSKKGAAEDSLIVYILFYDLFANLNAAALSAGSKCSCRIFDFTDGRAAKFIAFSVLYTYTTRDVNFT